MAKSWQYPRWRRYAMQATMWLILGATLGLAAFVNHERRAAMRVELGPPTPYGAVAVRLPRDWDVAAPTEGDPRVVVRATESADASRKRRGDPGRVVTVLRERLPATRGPLEHLLISISQAAAVHGPPKWADATEAIEIGGWPGLMVALHETEQGNRPAAPQRGWARKVFVACAVLPSRHAVVVRLESSDTDDLSDVEVLKQIAAAVTVSGQPPLGQPGETVALEGGARVTAPQGLRPVYENDPNRIERQLWGSGDARSWTSGELVPILITPDAATGRAGERSAAVERPGDPSTPRASDETRSILAALEARDRRLRGATIEPDGPRRWRVVPPATSFSDLFPSAMYVIADERTDRGAISAGPRRAVLAVFRGAPGMERRFEQAWESIASGVSFVGETSYAAMLETGAAEARRLSDRGMARLVRAPRDEQWWLWLDDDEHVNLGWSSVAWDLAARGDAPNKRHTLRRGPDGRLVRVTEEWEGDLRRYDLRAETTSGDGSESFKQRASLDTGELEIEETGARGKRNFHARDLAPPQYVPGAWLSMLIGDLARQPMILRTESFVRHEGSGPSEPMTLIVTHNPEATTRSAVDGTPLRCVTVQVNGSGEVSRWFFREDGRTERIEFAAGLRRLPSDLKTVRFTFDQDESLKP